MEVLRVFLRTKPLLGRQLLSSVLLYAIIAIAMAVFASPKIEAAPSIPYKINFQGRLTDTSGALKADGLYNMKFRIFDAASAGTQLWTETRETTNRVQVTNGLFSVQLGDVSALSPSLFNSASPIYFEIELPTPATANCSTAACGTFSEGAMTPRNRLGASAYAFNADTVDGIDGVSIAQVGTANTFTLANTFNNTVTVDNTSASSFIVKNGSNQLFNVDASASVVKIGAGNTSDATGITLVLDTKNSAGDPTGVVGAMYYNSSSSKFRCYQGAAWTDCIAAGGGGGSLQASYDSSATTNPQILLSSTNGGIKIQDGTTPVTGNLFQIGPNGSTTISYFGVSSTAVKLQDTAGNDALTFDSSTSHLKVYENVASPTRFADVYYDTATSSAIFAASSGTTQIGTGSGNIVFTLSGATDQLLATKTNTLAAAYSATDFKFTRNLTAGANAVTGNVMTVEDLTAFSGGSSAPNVLYINQNNTSATGNLILAQTGGTTDKFKVTTAGNVTAAGGITIGTGASYTSTGALTVDSASGTALNIGTGANAHNTTIGNAAGTTALTLQAGTGGLVLKPITSSTTALTLQDSGGQNFLIVDTTNDRLQVGDTAADATGVLLVLDTKNNVGDPTGVNGAMYYNSNAGKFRCFQASAWADCIGAGGGGSTLQAAYDASGSPATITTTAAKSVSIVAGAPPTADMFTISNAGQAVATDGVNGIGVNYIGGAGAIEGAGIRIDSTPGGTSGSTWSGLRIVADATGPATGVTSYGIKLEGPTVPGAGTEIGLRVASGFDIGLDVSSGGLQLSAMNDPAAPAMGDLRVYAKTNAGRTMLKMKGGSGVDVALQPFFGANRIQLVQPFASTTTFATGSYYGMSAPTIGGFTVGTATASTLLISRAIASPTNLFTSMRRGGILTSTGAGTIGGIRGGTSAPVQRGNGNATGGFYYVARFGISAYQASLRTFAGLYTSASAPANANPSTLLNIMGVGCDSTDTTFQFISNDAGGAAARVSLGANFPCNTSNADMYEVRLFSAPSGSTIYYSLSRLNTTDFVEGSVTASADMPANTALLYPHVYINNTTAAQAGIDFASLYIETDN